jgi:uncharacterized protein YecE (DUF72 family)
MERPFHDRPRILVGTCNWVDHERFYPPRIKPTDRLLYYARYFPVVEVDSTFYALMPVRNFEGWAKRTPPGFTFNVKAYRSLTKHQRDADGQPLDPSASDFERFHYSLEPLREAGKLKAVHFQFPPWFTASEENLEHLDTCRAVFPDDLLAVEFRHRSWFEGENCERTLAFLKKQEMVHVIVDAPQIGTGTVPPVLAVTNPELAIFRFHGRNRRTWYIKGARISGDRYDYLYSREELAEWTPRIERVAENAAEVHVMLNNNRSNYAVTNAFDFQDLLGGAATPWNPDLGFPEVQLPLPLEA